MGLPEPGAVLCGCGPKTHLKAEELQLQCGSSVVDVRNGVAVHDPLLVWVKIASTNGLQGPIGVNRA